MNAATFRRFVAIAGAVAVVATITTIDPTTAKVEEGNRDRPCFMVRSMWNNAEGPQPTCPNGRFKKAASEDAGASRPVPSSRPVAPPRVSDFMQ